MLIGRTLGHDAEMADAGHVVTTGFPRWVT